jgi:hypothetical protein
VEEERGCGGGGHRRAILEALCNCAYASAWIFPAFSFPVPGDIPLVWADGP